MTERLQKLFVMLRHTIRCAMLYKQLPDAESDNEMHQLLCRCYEASEPNLALLDELSYKFFAEKFGVKFCQTVVRVVEKDARLERAFVLTGVEMSSHAYDAFVAGAPTSPVVFLLWGKYYDEEDGHVAGTALFTLDETKGNTLQIVAELPTPCQK